MELQSSTELDCTLGDVIKLQGLKPGMLIHCANDITILVGDCSPNIRPTNNDGGIGWDYSEDYCQLKVKRIDLYKVPSLTSSPREHTPIDLKKLMSV